MAIKKEMICFDSISVLVLTSQGLLYFTEFCRLMWILRSLWLRQRKTKPGICGMVNARDFLSMIEQD